MTQDTLTAYEKLGASAKKTEFASALTTARDRAKKAGRLELFPGTFTPVFADRRNPDACIVPHADGVGTKSSLAYLYWKETGDVSVFKNIAWDSIIMNVDDVICVGGVNGQMFVVSHVNRNARFATSEMLGALFEGAEELYDLLSSFGIDIMGGVGETADVADVVRIVSVDNTLTCLMDKKDVINNANIKAGDLIVGLSSIGQATYEREYNGGISSNGLTLARHGVFSKIYAEKYPESFDGGRIDVSYQGNLKVTDRVKAEDGKEYPVGRLMLSPTRTFAPIVKKMQEDIAHEDIHGLIHCSGGGQTKILKCIPDGLSVVKDNLPPAPVLFRTIQEQANVSDHEMYEDYNMGSRLDICVPNEKVAEQIIAIAKSFNVDAWVIGRIEASDKKTLEIRRAGKETLVYPKG